VSAFNIPTAAEKRAQIEEERPANLLRLMKHIADRIDAWNSDGSLPIPLGRVEAVHVDAAIEHLRTLGYRVRRSSDGWLGLTLLTVSVPKEGTEAK
jgi:hypothetical protein